MTYGSPQSGSLMLPSSVKFAANFSGKISAIFRKYLGNILKCCMFEKIEIKDIVRYFVTFRNLSPRTTNSKKLVKFGVHDNIRLFDSHF